MNQVIKRIDVSAENSVDLVKTYISIGFPVEAAVAVNNKDGLTRKVVRNLTSR